MADHLSMQIRAALKARLGNVAALSGHVFGRTHPLDETQLPAGQLWFEDNSSVRQPVSGVNTADPMSLMTDSFNLDVTVKTSADVDDALDALRRDVRVALMVDRKLGGLTRDLRITGVTRKADLEGDRKIAQDAYAIEADYLCRDSAPDTAIRVN